MSQSKKELSDYYCSGWSGTEAVQAGLTAQ